MRRAGQKLMKLAAFIMHRKLHYCYILITDSIPELNIRDFVIGGSRQRKVTLKVHSVPHYTLESDNSR